MRGNRGRLVGVIIFLGLGFKERRRFYFEEEVKEYGYLEGYSIFFWKNRCFVEEVEEEKC